VVKPKDDAVSEPDADAAVEDIDAEVDAVLDKVGEILDGP
jgi:hypothetical protein